MRSLFSKILGAQVVLVLLIFMTLIIASSYLLEHYFHQAKQREVLANADHLLERLQEATHAGEMESLFRTFNAYTGTHAWIIDTSGRPLVELEEGVTSPSVTAKDLTQLLSGDAIVRRERVEGSPRPALIVLLPLPAGDAGVAGSVVVKAPLIGVNSTVQGVRRLLALAGFIAVSLAFSASYILSRRIASPLTQLTEAVGKMAKGDFAIAVPPEENDEVGQLAIAFNQLARELDRTVKRLQHESMKTTAVLESMGDGVVVLSADGSVDLWNRAAADLVTAATRSDHPSLRPDLSRAVLPLFTQAMEESAHLERDIEIDRRQYTLKISPIAGSGATAPGAVCVFRDTSERRAFEEMRREFVANVSHELRTPLTSIKGFLEAIVDGVARNPQEVEEYLRIAIEETDRMRRLALTLLDLTSIESGEVRLSRRNERLQGIIARALDKMTPQIRTKEIEVELVIPDHLPLLHVDSDKIEQVLLNLLDNAVRYSPRAGVIAVVAASLPAKGRPDGATVVRVEVQDSGPGLDEVERGRVWERFYRRDRSRQSTTGGAGLGLAIAKELIEAHGGTVGAQSSPKGGSSFYFEIPAAPA